MHTAILTIDDEHNVETFSLSPNSPKPTDRSAQRDLEDWLGLGYQVVHYQVVHVGHVGDRSALLVLTKGSGK